MSFLLVNGILLLIIVFLLLVLSMVWPPDSPWAPWWRTNKKIARAVCRLAKIGPKDKVYELGCGDAIFLITAAKEFGARGVGVEIDPLRSFLAKLLVRYVGVSDKAKIIKGNFFDQNLSSATLVFVYLVPKALQRLLPKLLKELKPGTKIISYRYEIDLPLVTKDKREKIFVYKTPKNPSSISEAKSG